MASLTLAPIRIALIAAAIGVAAVASVAQDRSGETRSWQAAWEARHAREAGRREAERIRREYERRRAVAHARMRSQPDTLYASRPDPAPDAMCPVAANPEARRAYQSELRQRREAAFRRATGLPLQTGFSVHPVPKRTMTPAPATGSLAMSAGSHPSPATITTAARSVSNTESGRMVPLFPSASDALGRQGFARVINHGDEAGEVTINAFDDKGASHGPLALAIGAGETVHFNSADLENGNAGKGLSGSTGPGEGDWRLELDSGLDIEVLSYIRTGDGFLTAMHDTAPEDDGGHRVAIFNPGSNANQQSRLRLVNPGDVDASVAIAGTDDTGASPGDGATVALAARSSATYTAAELESGNADGLTGSIGDGTGKWRLTVESEQDIVAMSLLSSPTGHLTNLSTAPDNETGGTHAVPLFPSASDANGRQGFLRVVNHADEAGEVTIGAFDDTDHEYEALTLAIGANETKHFNSDDLELGNAGKGLTGSTGAGEGHWRLELTSDLDIDVLAYIRTTDGFLTAIHDPAPRSAKRHRVAVFNPGSNANQVSVLRLVNAGHGSASVTVTGVDDRGGSPGDGVRVTVPAGGSASYTAAELESGNAEGLDGSLGDGSGKWRLAVNADRPIVAMSLLSSPTGHLTNLSTAPQRGAGPVETAEEAFEALISPIVQSKCVNCHYEGNTTGNMPVFVRDTDVDHQTTNLKEFEDYLADIEDGANRILIKIQGALEHGGGSQVSAGTPEFAGFEQFLELLGAEIEEFVAVDLFEGVTLESPRRTLWRAAIVFADRIPTEDEYASIENGDDGGLRLAIRGLMDCPEDQPRHQCGFHEFLIRGANDRLLTDREARWTIDNDGHFVHFTNKHFRLEEAAQRTGSEADEVRRAEWISRVQYGAARAPLELIAHVVENELEYTEILTADYVMANPWSAEAYESNTKFEDSEDPHEFRPAKILGYYRKGEGFEERFVPGVGPIVDKYPESLRVADYPHAGILNGKAFLQRYPTTVTNRNRARSRWTYYHFLGFDVEKSKLRTMDPAVLDDTNNPTMNNPACTGCHVRLDPVAGAFQNYGDVGNYRDRWGGHDSLDEHYENGRATGREETVNALSWEQRQTVSVKGHLPAGPHAAVGLTVVLPPDSDHASGWSPHLGIDRLTIRDDTGTWERLYELEELFADHHGGDGGCGYPESSSGVGDSDSFRLWECLLRVPVEVPESGNYVVDIETWILADDGRDPDATATMRVSVPYLYQDGDTWYRDMREPGFVREPGLVAEKVPADSNDNSLQWLAQRIVEDDRFAEAAVKFWWPSIMGSEIVGQPESSVDVDYEVRKLEADAQHDEIRRLADGFRTGFGWSGEGAYNLKDLLVELVMSPWFRAAATDIVDAERAEALRKAGAKRLLTPDELAKKTRALTGFQWIRYRPDVNRPPHQHGWSGLTDTEHGYGLLYGGIDSEGVIERARDMTAIMAGVAQSHALESSCPVVLRELYLLPERERLLFGGIEARTTPAYEFGNAFEISASSRAAMERVTVEGPLRAGEVTVALAFLNDFQDDAGNNRDLLLDRLILRRGDEVVEKYEMENHEHDYDCHHIEQDAFHLSVSGPGCVLTVPLDIPEDGQYAVDVWAWAEQAGKDLAEVDVLVESDTESSAGSDAIRNKLAELYDKLLGAAAPPDSPEISTAYNRFVEIWERKRARAGNFPWNDWNDDGLSCGWDADDYYFAGIASGLWDEDHRVWDSERVDEYFADIDLGDTGGAARTWTVVLAYLLSDYRYLHL